MKSISRLGLVFFALATAIRSGIIKKGVKHTTYEDRLVSNYEDGGQLGGIQSLYPELVPSTLDPSFDDLVKGKNIDHHLARKSKLVPLNNPKSIHELVQHSMLRNIEDLQNRQLIRPSNHRLASLKKEVKSPQRLATWGSFSRKLALARRRKWTKKQKNSAREAPKKSKSGLKRKLQAQGGPSASTSSLKGFLDQWFVPERIGALALGGGFLSKFVKGKSHQKRMAKLQKLKHNQDELNLHTMNNESMLKRISEALKRTNHQVDYMRGLASDRLANKIDQLRVF